MSRHFYNMLASVQKNLQINKFSHSTPLESEQYQEKHYSIRVVENSTPCKIAFSFNNGLRFSSLFSPLLCILCGEIFSIQKLIAKWKFFEILFILHAQTHQFCEIHIVCELYNIGITRAHTAKKNFLLSNFSRYENLFQYVK